MSEHMHVHPPVVPLVLIGSKTVPLLFSKTHTDPNAG